MFDDPTLKPIERSFCYKEIWAWQHSMRVRHWRADQDGVRIERTSKHWIVSGPRGFVRVYTHAQIHGCVVGPATRAQ